MKKVILFVLLIVWLCPVAKTINALIAVSINHLLLSFFVVAL
jgi:hypothetical protein